MEYTFDFLLRQAMHAVLTHLLFAAPLAELEEPLSILPRTFVLVAFEVVSMVASRFAFVVA